VTASNTPGAEGKPALNRHLRADDSMSSRTGRKATDGDSSDPIVTTAASSQADTVSAGQPGEALPHPARRGPETGAAGPGPCPAAPRTRPRSTGPLAPGRPREHVPDHRRPVAPPRQQPRRKKNVRRPARGAPRPPRPDRHRNPARRENPPPDRVTPPAQPPAAARTRKQAVTEERLDAGRAVAYREQWCLRAPSRPSPDFGKKVTGRTVPHSQPHAASSPRYTPIMRKADDNSMLEFQPQHSQLLP
jgi:hypothetical protein